MIFLLSPEENVTLPVETGLPPPSFTSMPEKAGTSCSLKLMRISLGDVFSVAPALGLDDRSLGCALAAVAPAASEAIKRIAVEVVFAIIDSFQPLQAPARNGRGLNRFSICFNTCNRTSHYTDHSCAG